ncbi:DUF6997 domain-containing protein [Clostridium cochlearium]|uniref:DUF6997 domain-containing protein n=1 Tax=Clostridium cochlearium TaxID=1494 RepID=A0A1G9HEI1_CLOCO|nr:hypothetical protein [Clostridium cochlearium]MBE6063823.1 hypothetical protein [Clostridium cochlearium]MBU5269217.1 hypothetical protein [Clostridium cochlearium]NOH15418.1 hypothetical protein [Clostridium cochlearium]SDL11400.1 hypothetical protein SAMN05216497_10787 [Clostridium cochlearium]
MANSIFKNAITQILKNDSNKIFGPISFNKYLKENNICNVSTAQNISIDSYEKLNKELRDNNIMVLRLGNAIDSKGTQFALIKTENINDYFLIDDEIFTKCGYTYLPTKSIRDLFAYQVFPFLSESSFVNLGVVSGLISRALGLDEYNVPLTPAMGKSVFTFKLYPYSKYKDVIFTHNNGQVEIDGVLVAERKEKQTVFVLEAKSDKSHKSLSKHKLVYPVLALAKNVPKDMEIVPVYIKIFKEEDGIHYHVVECKLPDPRKKLIAIDELKVKRYSHLVLPIFDLK